MHERTNSFGYWLRRRRKALDLTQEALAQSVSCSRFAIRKIEADERRPSRRLAERLADRLAIGADERPAFLDAARAIHAVDRLALGSAPLVDAMPTAAPAAAPGEVPALARIPFVGRTREYGQLLGLLARLTSGQGHVVLIEGEPGIGKSRLLREFAQHARHLGLHTLAANGYAIEQGMPYQPVTELVGQALDQCASAALQRLGPIALAELAALVPALAERVPDLPPLQAQLPEARQARLFRAVEQLVDAVAGAMPLVVVVDDLHWVDDASLQFLHYFARHAVQRRVVLLLAYRGEEVAADERVATVIDSIRREPHARHFLLERLSAADTEALLCESADPALLAPGLASWLHRETDGHPFFLVSILQSLAEQGLLASPEGWRQAAEAGMFPSATAPTLPEALRASVRSRLARVPREALSVLEVAAVLGRHFDFDTLQAITNETEAALSDAIDLLVKRRLLREEAEVGEYDFSHDKVREAVYLDIGSMRRRLLHRAVADVVEQLPTGDATERAARLAEHWERAHAWARAVAGLAQAADRSQRLFATREASRLLDRAIALSEAHAIDHPTLLSLLERRGAVRAQAGNTAGAVADFERVIECVRASGERERERDLLIQLGMACRRGDAYERASHCLQQALAASRAMGDERHAADTLYHLGTVAWSNGRNALAIGYHQEAVGICERLGLDDLVAVQAYHGRGEAWFAEGRPALAIDCYTRSIEFARRIGDKSYECENLMMVGWACSGWMGLGDYARTIANCEASLAIAEAADLEWHVGPILIARDFARACLGDYRAAWASLQDTLARLETLKLVRYQIMAHNMLGHMLLDLGRSADAVEQLQRGLRIANDAKIVYWTALLRANLAIAHARLGHPESSGALEQSLAQTQVQREGWMEMRTLEALAELCLAQGQAQRCAGHAERLAALAAQGELREWATKAQRWRGEAAIESKAWDCAQHALQASLDTARQIGHVRLQWDAHRALARLAHARRKPELRQQHAAACGALAERIAANLQGTGLTAELAAVDRS